MIVSHPSLLSNTYFPRKVNGDKINKDNKNCDEVL